MKIFIILLLALSTSVSAEVGFRFQGDLNDDGIDDILESGPRYLFGADGSGPFLITLSNTKGAPHTAVSWFYPTLIALEKSENGNLLWGHIQADSKGTLFKVSLDGNFTYESISTNRGRYSTSELADVLVEFLFDEKSKFLLKLDVIKNYEPRQYDWEK